MVDIWKKILHLPPLSWYGVSKNDLEHTAEGLKKKAIIFIVN